MLSWLELLNNKIEDGIVHLDLFLNSYIPIFKYDMKGKVELYQFDNK